MDEKEAEARPVMGTIFLVYFIFLAKTMRIKKMTSFLITITNAQPNSSTIDTRAGEGIGNAYTR